MKVAYCLNSLSDCGGIERVTIAKANSLAWYHGCEVWLLITDNYQNPILELADGVHLVDLGVKYYVNQSPNPIIDAWRESKKRRLHKTVLQERLNQILPDVVVSVGLAEKNFLPTLKIDSHPVFVRELHFCTHYRSLFANSKLKKLLAALAEFYDYKCCIHRYDRIVTLTQTDKNDSWHDNNKVVVIPNPIIQKPSKLSNCQKPIVMAVGRLRAEKNFSSLLRAWHLVEQKHPDWSLQIWGDGAQKDLLQQEISRLRLKSVRLMGYSADIHNRYAEASMLAATSRFEGFGLMIVEAMAAGLPVVSYDCPNGPRDIISDGRDGFLASMGDETALANRLCWLIEHPEDRQKMGNAAKEKSARYDMEKIAGQWFSFFKSLINHDS